MLFNSVFDVHLKEMLCLETFSVFDRGEMG